MSDTENAGGMLNAEGHADRFHPFLARTFPEMLDALRPHDHLCLIYDRQEDWRAATIPFIRMGLKKGEKCIYIADAHTAKEIRRSLGEEGIAVAEAERSGRFTLLQPLDAYTRAGYFDPDRMIRLLISETEKAVAEGYPALRVTGEMTWVLRDLPGSDRLLEYEARLNTEVFPNYPCLAICQYERPKFDPAIIKGVIMTHPLVVVNNRIYRNFYYVPPEEFLGGKRDAVEVRHWLENLDRETSALDALRKSEEEYRLLFESTNVGILIAQDGYIKKPNPYLFQLLGYLPAELDEQPFSRFIHPEDVSLVTTLHQERLSGKSDLPQTYDFRVISKNGTILWVQLSTVVIEWQGRPATLNFLHDITERKEAEEALRKSEEKYRTLFETITEGIALHEVVYDEAGNAVNYRILDVNPAFERHTGIPVAAIRGKLATEAYGRDEPPYLSRYAEVVVTGKRTAFETYYPPMQRHFYITAFSPAPGHFGTVFQDITERKRAEEQREELQSQLLQAQRLESVGRLAGGVAHDFNNMLNVILGYGEIILNQLRPGDPLREDVKEIVEAGHRSAALTRQLLAFSRKQTLKPEVLDLNKVIQELENMLHRLIGEDIELELVLSEDIARVMADPGQIEQVIMNLAVNARDAMPKGGKLLLETANVELDEAYARTHAGVTPGKYVMLAVTDTGAGMDEETLTKIFEPFFSTKEKGKGTGLGLSTVYGIIKQSGGNIWAYSEPGRGTTFKIYLPQTEVGPEARPVAAQKETTRGAGEQILVVEDEGSLRKLVGAMLSKLGYKVSLAANGGEALLLMEKKGLKPDLVITDVVMPNMSGKEFVERLKRTQPDLKVLYMSGYTDNAIVHHGVLDPGIPFIQKPFTLDDIAEKVQAALRGEQGYGVSP